MSLFARKPRAQANRILPGILLLIAFSLPLGAKGNEYRIGPRDLIDIQVFELPELSVSRRVEGDGRITLPLVGPVEVQGLTESELATRLEEVLELRYVQRASVSVEVQEFRSHPISVIGAVGKPGPLDYSGRWTLMEVLTGAGGLAGNHGDVIHILRRVDNGLADQLTIRIDDLLLRGDSHVNIPIQAGDIVNVPATVDLTVFCLGEVSSPGALTFKSTQRMTLLSAIARAGGLGERASRNVLIKRRSDRGEEEIEIDFKRILAGKAPDVELLEGDVIVVKESFF